MRSPPASRIADDDADPRTPDVLALLGAACLAAERGRWDEAPRDRDRAPAVRFDGFRPRP